MLSKEPLFVHMHSWHVVILVTKMLAILIQTKTLDGPFKALDPMGGKEEGLEVSARADKDALFDKRLYGGWAYTDRLSNITVRLLLVER